MTTHASATELIATAPPTPGSGAQPHAPEASTKRDLFGINLDAVDPERSIAKITRWATAGQPATVAFTAVHGVVTAAHDPAFRTALNAIDLVNPDGQPLRWALRWFHGDRLAERVYGPHTMWKLCDWAAQNNAGIYLYGSTEAVITKLKDHLTEAFPGLNICGAESPPFRALTPEEDDAMVARINGSGAKLVFIGLGCPKQELFIHTHAGRITGVQLAVGAAFDFHAGTLKMAPPWMQKRGLEWLYRLIQEPRRLWRRYVGTNSVFLALCAKRALLGPRNRGQAAPVSTRTTPDDAAPISPAAPNSTAEATPS